MRSSACDTLSRSCARRVLCWLTFPSASALGSTDSAAGCPALFVGFPATIAESDLPRPFIIGYGSSPSRCGPERRTAAGQTWDLPVPIQGASAHARFFDHAGPFGPCDGASETCCLPRSKQRRPLTLPGCFSGVFPVKRAGEASGSGGPPLIDFGIQGGPRPLAPVSHATD